MPMRTIRHLDALLALALLVGAGVAAALHDDDSAREDPEAPPPEGADASSHGGHGGGAHAWQGGTGEVPRREQALLELERRGRIVIQGDAAFNPANGVRGGTGTFDDPFVISGWFVDVLLVADTTRAFEIRENYVNEILVLDWTGAGGYVHHNHVNNLRTNRNVARTGDPSASVIEHNVIERVEELRHFDGELRNNTIGRPGPLPLAGQQVALNIAGLNGAGIHHNTIHGGVDMKIHGHHHADAPAGHTHNHGRPDSEQQEGHVEDHQVRYVDFRFSDNRILDDGFGLRYNDLDHAGDDRTATSEQEPDLELPHVHHTTVTIARNVIDGATLRVVVLNAPDERHLPGQTATLRVLDNRILRPSAGDGIVVQDVRQARVEISGNVVERGSLQLVGTSAIFLQRFANSTVHVDGNTFADWRYGVRAHDFDAATRWVVGANRGNAAYPVYWDDTVANPPEKAASGDGHAHGRSPEAALPRLRRA